jgi:hypothetical protein
MELEPSNENEVNDALVPQALLGVTAASIITSGFVEQIPEYVPVAINVIALLSIVYAGARNNNSGR